MAEKEIEYSADYIQGKLDGLKTIAIYAPEKAKEIEYEIEAVKAYKVKAMDVKKKIAVDVQTNTAEVREFNQHAKNAGELIKNLRGELDALKPYFVK